MPGSTNEGEPELESGADDAPLKSLIDASELTPAQIVEALDRHVVGQDAAKRALAVALRNRARRQAIGGELARDITPRNILMIGPTGVGKTELARRLSRLTGSPFIKVEASKFTEVGYVGRDVESMVRDLVAQAVNLVREEQEAAVKESAQKRVEDRLLDLLVPTTPADGEQDRKRKLEAVRGQLRTGGLDDREIEIEVTEPNAMTNLFDGPGMENVNVNLGAILPGFMNKQKKLRKVEVAEARRLLYQEETSNLVDDETVNRLATERVETSGIIFLDEIDKVAGREGGSGPDVSREGVQRDLLPIVEGTAVQTKWGTIRTDHILFIAAGAFHVSKPSDLIPELQGRFAVRVNLDSLGMEDFVRILEEPDASLKKQAEALLATEGLKVDLSKEALEAMAACAVRVNAATEDIGARRLHTIMEKVLEDLSFRAPDLAGESIVIDAAYVSKCLDSIIEDEDYTRYVL